MSEVKTNEPVKQEGDFKLKSKPTKPKQLSKSDDAITKVNIKEPLVELPPEVIKVTIPKDESKTKEDAIQKQETESPVLLKEQPEVGLQEVGQGDDVTAEDGPSKFKALQEVTDEEVKEIKQVTKEAQEAVRDEKILGKKLPENIEKLIAFMEDTGGNVQDYVRLNADYSQVSENQLLKEYYKSTKPYLEPEDVDLILEDYEYDEDIEEDRDIRKKKIALKEEVAKAKNFLESTKSKYYDEIKLRSGVTQEQQKATDFFNRFNKEQETAEKQHLDFKTSTNKYFSDEFKGFDFDVSGKKFRYGVQDASKVASDQSNINNFVEKFLDKKGSVVDTKGYHKALYMASNADAIVNHFYEQVKADAVRDVIGKSKNITNKARTTGSGDNGFINGFKVKAISGYDSSKLSIKKRKI